MSTNFDDFRRPLESAIKLLTVWFSNFQCIFHLERVNHGNYTQKDYWGIVICILYVLKYFEESNNFLEGVVGHMADHSGYKIHTYVLTANVSTYVTYVNTFVCQKYLHKIVALRVSISGRQKQICRAKISCLNSSDTQMYWHMLHMRKHLQPMHIYLNIINMLTNS